MSSLDDSLAASLGDLRREELRKDVAEMVSLRVRVWGSIELDESAFKVAVAAEESTQQRLSPEQLEVRAREERRRITQAASGGPVRRLSATGE